MLKLLTYFLVLILKFLIPRDKNLVVFGHRAGRRFGDNSRSLFFYLNKKMKEKKCIWITKNKLVLKDIKKIRTQHLLSQQFFRYIFLIES